MSPKTPDPKSVTFLTPDDLTPLLARLDALEAGAVELETRVADHDTMLQDHEERVTVLEGAPGPEPPEPSDVPPVDKATWEQHMLTYGETHGQYLLTHPNDTADQKIGFVYYDMCRVMYQIADYTGDPEPWNTYAKQAMHWYRDVYIIPNNANVPGYENFTTGLRLDYERTGDAASKEWAITLSTNAAYAADTTPPEYVATAALSREVAYALLSYINAEQLGAARRDMRARYVTLSHDYLRQWQDRSQWGGMQVSPFMCAITAQALIADWEETQDPRCLPALRALADWCWPLAWHAPTQAMLYQMNPDCTVEGFSTVGAPDLNLIIAPWYSWLWGQTGEDGYREQFDQLLAGSAAAWLDGGKQFNQSYWWSPQGMAWREGGPA